MFKKGRNLVTCLCVSWSTHLDQCGFACDVLTATSSVLMPEGSLSTTPVFSVVYITARTWEREKASHLGAIHIIAWGSFAETNACGW